MMVSIANPSVHCTSDIPCNHNVSFQLLYTLVLDLTKYPSTSSSTPNKTIVNSKLVVNLLTLHFVFQWRVAYYNLVASAVQPSSADWQPV